MILFYFISKQAFSGVRIVVKTDLNLDYPPPPPCLEHYIFITGVWPACGAGFCSLDEQGSSSNDHFK